MTCHKTFPQTAAILQTLRYVSIRVTLFGAEFQQNRPQDVQAHYLAFLFGRLTRRFAKPTGYWMDRSNVIEKWYIDNRYENVDNVTEMKKKCYV